MKYLLVIATLLLVSQANFYIDDYGAVANSDTLDAQLANQQALMKAIAAANRSAPEYRKVVIPKKAYYFMPVHTQRVHNLSLLILGKVIASKNVRNWPSKSGTQLFQYWEFLTFHFCDNLTISGGGKIDGRGYHWWILTLLDYKKYLPNQSARPHLMHLYACRNTIIHDLVLKNSPQFHIKMDDCNTAEIYNLNIKVNTTAQINLLKYFSLEGVIPMFPFNTDGIDPHGSNMHIYNLTVQNWDDVVVPKPGCNTDMYNDCSQNYLIENCTVVLGVGMTIGSISPSKSYNCIKNVTFRNIHMKNPLKGIYIKTNPGDEGHGIVSNIVYQNLTMIGPKWWAVYIGPQQMKEPDGDGPGCMLYPFDPKGSCTTQPLVTLQNITLRNIAITDSWFYPVTIRCNVSNPCRYFVFENVTTNKWYVGQHQTGVVCQYVTGSQRNNNPVIPCFYDGLEQEQKQPMLENDSQLSRHGIPTAEKLWKELFEAARLNPYHDEDDDDMSAEFEFIQF